ncbi:hypothetical protein [Nonomuraea sp. JJY05]|uniref:hypothetical protein n=1 Tax=Nonomuraea sp. JJY05 TaxID=3350255 RepID=UPI00373E672F
MHALDAATRQDHVPPAEVPGRMPGDVCQVSLEVSYNQGKTWLAAGTQTVPTCSPDKAARAFLMAAMTSADDPELLWQVSAQPCPANGHPSSVKAVVLRSDGPPG